MNRRLVGVLCFLLALAFAANTLWLFPHSDEPRYEYRAVELTDENQHQFLEHHPEVKECYIIFSRGCGLEHRVREEPLRFDLSETDAPEFLEVDYRFVLFSDGFRKPTYRTQNGTLILTSKSISEGAVVAELATPYEHTRSLIRRILDGGNVTTRHELPRNELVRRNGTVYAVEKIGESHFSYDVELAVLRGVLWLLTIPLSVASFVYWYGD